MLAIGLTGGIGSGKSEVSQRFAELGVPIVDTDLISRNLVTAGGEALKEIASRLGAHFVTNAGDLDRQRLREAVFRDKSLKTRLEDILHPRIRDQVVSTLSGLDAPYAIVVIPLLLESRYPIPVDRVLVVDAPEELQVVRVKNRDSESGENVKRIIASQASRNARNSAADDTITNDGDLASLDTQVKKLHARYLALAAAGH